MNGYGVESFVTRAVCGFKKCPDLSGEESLNLFALATTAGSFAARDVAGNEIVQFSTLSRSRWSKNMARL